MTTTIDRVILRLDGPRPRHLIVSRHDSGEVFISLGIECDLRLAEGDRVELCAFLLESCAPPEA